MRKEAYLSNRTFPDPTAMPVMEKPFRRPDALTEAEKQYVPTTGQIINGIQTELRSLRRRKKAGSISTNEFRLAKRFFLTRLEEEKAKLKSEKQSCK
jgi:hypothetical protein